MAGRGENINGEQKSTKGYVTLNRRFTESQIKETALVFWECGANQKETSRRTGINRTTIIKWMNDSQVWADAMDAVNAQYDRRFLSKCTQIINLTLDKMIEKVSEDKTGLRDLAHTAALCIDRRQLIQNRPTSISGRSVEATDKRLADMAKRLQEFSKKVEKGHTVVDAVTPRNLRYFSAKSGIDNK